LIDDIDRWVLGRCLLVLSERARLGRPVRLFVSQSLNAMRDPSRLPWLRQQLETRRIGGERLVVDLRFEGDVSTLDSLVGFAAAIKQLGAAVCLAGMEARDADFTAIERVPSDFVKLTPRYLSDRGAGTRDEMRRLVHFAHERGKRVIAPQIEDAQSAALLWTVGVDYIQGNFVQHAAQELDYDFRAAAS
jgi:EAL domain-containing protein (putative c-di-GMP-specific phosphodiesterase class I)